MRTFAVEMNRIISFLHCFGIVFIVIWHAQAIKGSVGLMDWIYSFVLPILFFASGYLFNEKDFWKKKTRRILVPYFLFSTLIFFPKVLLSRFALRSVELSWESYFYQLVLNPTENVNITLWFLPSLFLVMLLFMLLHKTFFILNCTSLRWLLIVLYSIFAIVVYGMTSENEMFISRTVLYSSVFIFGHEVQRMGWLTAPFTNDWIMALVGLLATSLVVFVPDNRSWPYFLFMICGIAMSIAFASLYERYQLHFLDHLFGTNMTIYLYHWFVQSFVIAVWRQVGEPSSSAFIMLFQGIAIIGGVYLPWLLHSAMVRYKRNVLIKCLRVISGMK